MWWRQTRDILQNRRVHKRYLFFFYTNLIIFHKERFEPEHKKHEKRFSMRDDGGRHLWTTPNPAKNLTQTQALSVPILSNHEHFFHF